MEYHIEPHIVLEGALFRAEGGPGVQLATWGTSSVSRWPQAVPRLVGRASYSDVCLQTAGKTA